MAEGMPAHLDRVGIEGHRQEVVFSGGPTGSPQGLWIQPNKRAAIQAILDDGDIELFAMTYHPDYPTLEGYRNRVNYALAQNPDTRFFIALPWPTTPALMSFTDYEMDMADYDHDPGYTTDIKTIASDIMARHDTAYDHL